MFYRGEWNATDQVPERAIAEGVDLAIRPHRPDQRRRDASLQPVDRRAVGWRQHVDTSQCVLRELRAESLLELHVLSRRSGQRRPVRAGGSPQCLRRPGHAHAAEHVGRSAGRKHVRRAGAARSHRIGRALSHDGAPAAVDDPRRQGGAELGRDVRAERISMEPCRADNRRAAGRCLQLRRRGRRPSQLRNEGERPDQPQSVGRSRPVEWNRALRQRRRRISQQRRAGLDDDARSRHRTGRSIRRLRSSARTAPSSACARCEFRRCRRPLPCGLSASIPSCCSSETPERPKRRGRAAASASNGPHMRGRVRGSRSTPTSRSREERFTDDDPAGDRIPGSVESVIALGASFDSAAADLRQRSPASLRRALARRRRQRSLAGDHAW